MTDTQHTHHHDEEHTECRHLLSSLSAYIDGDLEAALCAEIEAHMADCENCRIVVNTLSKTVELYTSSAPAEALPPAVRDRLYAKLDLTDLLNAPAPEDA
jgi:anti-sigma factor RsiW